VTVKEDLELLMKLQGIDYDLGELERSKEYIPDMMENLQREIEETEKLYQKTEEELSQAKVAQKNLEIEVADQQANLKKLQGQMMAIKTNKEYDALVAQIDAVKEAINENETRLLETIEKIETLEGNIEDYKKRAGETKEQNTRQLEILKKKMDSVGSKMQGYENERNSISSRVPRRIMSIYERVRRSRGGSVVVAVKKRACGACFKDLSPHLIQELKRGNQLITCDNCGRLLIWDENESD
jgi:predicted  nucleic acid-binding Zn-ribbon protein